MHARLDQEPVTFVVRVRSLGLESLRATYTGGDLAAS
jgi:hypothetical protein